jgi:sorbose reductase
VTGGGGTLALSSGRALLEHGLSNLILWDLSFKSTVSEIRKLRKDFPSSKVVEVVVDVRDGNDVASAIQETLKMRDRVNILYCFAGVVGCEHFLNMKEDAWRKVIDVNLTGSYNCAQAVAK